MATVKMRMCHWFLTHAEQGKCFVFFSPRNVLVEHRNNIHEIKNSQKEN